jgi:C1A family cysteine protease
MRKQLLVPVFASTLLFGCAGQAQLDNVAEEDAPLSSYDSVFKGAPANDSLPVIDFKADAIAAKNTELLQWQSPVRNQARRGVCTIFSTIGLMEHLYLKAGLAMPDFSEQYLQWSVKKQYGSFANSEGSNNSDNVNAITKYGIPEESLWAYNPNPWTATDDPECASTGAEGESLPTKCWTQGEPPAAALAAKQYKLPQGSYLSTRSIKSHMSKNHTAVVVGIDFFYQAWNHRLSTLTVSDADFRQGIVRNPNAKDVTESHKERAGHGILLVGWDDNLSFPSLDDKGQPVKDAAGNVVMQKGFYIFKNSWGTTRFGVDNAYGPGYGYIQYKYIDTYASAYVDTVPSLSTPNPTPACDYKCADYGYSANECYNGWQCDASGSCITYTNCH